MLPWPLRSVCEKLLGPKGSRSTPSHNEQVKHFIAALVLLASYRNDLNYDFYVRFVLGYRHCVVLCDCPAVDRVILGLLKHDPQVIPVDGYADRVPWLVSCVAKALRHEYESQQHVASRPVNLPSPYVGLSVAYAAD